MIGKKLKSSRGSSLNRVRYVYGSKKHDHDIQNIVTISTNCIAYKPEVGIKNNNQDDLGYMVLDMDVATKLKLGTEGKKKKPVRPIFHAVLSLDKGERLTNDQWEVAVKHYLKKMGFKKTNKYVAVLHEDTGNQHVHIVANRISHEPGFPMVNDKKDYERNMEAIWEIEEMFGLKKAARPEDTWNVAVGQRAVMGAAKVGEMPYKNRLAAKVGGCVERTRERNGDMLMFVRALRRQGVYVHLRYDAEGAPKGISYEFGDRVTAGSELKRARCTWQKLTGQEGIRYEPSMLPMLKAEISKRNPESKVRADRAREQKFYVTRGWIYMYFVPEDSSRHPFLKIKVKKTGAQVRAEIAYKEAMELVEAILLLLSLIFGGATYTAKKGNPKGDGYTEWDRENDPFPLLPDQPQALQQRLDLA